MTAPASAVRTFRILGPMFAGLGGLLACIALVLVLSRALFLQGAMKTEGHVIGVQNGVPSVLITLPSGPHTIQGSISSEPPSFAIGERVPVYFRADTGADAIIGSFFELWFVPVLLFGIGTPFAAIGAGFLLIVSQRNRRDSALRATGRKLDAKIVAVEKSLVRINRRPAKILVAEARNSSGQTMTFRSDAVLVEDSDWLGKSVVVYVDRVDPRRYSVVLDD